MAVSRCRQLEGAGSVPSRAVVSRLITGTQCVAMGLTALAAVVLGLSLLVCAFGEAWQQI